MLIEVTTKKNVDAVFTKKQSTTNLNCPDSVTQHCGMELIRSVLYSTGK